MSGREPQLERLVECRPAFDRRDQNPDGGIGGVTMSFTLKGDQGVVLFALLTPFYLPHVADELFARNRDKPDTLQAVMRPVPGVVQTHWRRPFYKGAPMHECCAYLDNQPCYPGSQYILADQYYQALLEKGSDGVWEKLEAYYQQTAQETAEL